MTMCAKDSRLTDWLDRHAVILIAFIPLLYLIANPSFGQNQAGDVDTWFYYGLAKSFWHPLGTDFSNNYYETRLPYIIPAAVIFSIQNDRVASLLFSYLVYCASAFPLFYVLRMRVSRPAALLAILLMTVDIFFMRAIGWQYVDNGVLAYSSLTLATLTKAPHARHHFLWVSLSGFFIASMLIIHLGSAPLALALFAYAFVAFDLKTTQWKLLIKLFLSGAAGAITCQALYGLLNMRLYGTHFLFEWQQIIAGLRSEGDAGLFEPLNRLFAQGWWLVLHIGVWIAAGGTLIAGVTGYFKPTKFQTYCSLSVFIGYLALLLCDYLHFTIFLGRSGLYASFFIPLSYLFIGSMVPPTMRTPSALIVGCLFACSLVLRGFIGYKLQGSPHTTPLVVGLLLGAILIALFLLRYKVVSFATIPIAACLSLIVTWPFSDQTDIYQARHAIVMAASGSLPYLMFNKQDPNLYRSILGLIGSFTWREWRTMCASFPDCWRQTIGQRYAFVVNNGVPGVKTIWRNASSAMPGVTFKDGTLIYRSKPLSIYRFVLSRTTIIPAVSLNSRVGHVVNGARIAVEGTNAGALTYGPYATLQPGRYEIVMHYNSSGTSGTWDVVADAAIMAHGSIPDSRNRAAEIDAFINLPRGAQTFEARTFYSGHGRLSVQDVAVRTIANSR